MPDDGARVDAEPVDVEFDLQAISTAWACVRMYETHDRPAAAARHEHSWVDSAIENTLFAEFAVVAVSPS